MAKGVNENDHMNEGKKKGLHEISRINKWVREEFSAQGHTAGCGF